MLGGQNFAAFNEGEAMKYVRDVPFVEAVGRLEEDVRQFKQ